MMDRAWATDFGLLLLSAILLSGCNLELNIHLDGSEQAEATPTPLSPGAPPPAYGTVPLPPTPASPPHAEGGLEVDGAIRDALWRPTSPRLGGEGPALWFDRFLPRPRPGVDFLDAPRLLDADELAEKVRETYPPLLLEAGVEGTVEVDVRVNETGGVDGVDLVRSSGHRRLDEAALEVALVQRFEPARDAEGRAVAARATMPITFRIR